MWGVATRVFGLLSGAPWENDPPTDKQLAFLRDLGVSEVPETKGEASRLIQAALVEVRRYEPEVTEGCDDA